MTISQPSSNDCSGCADARPRLGSTASLVRLAHRALACWRERRRAKADLARLAEAGDYLLLDVGLDPTLARRNPGAVLDQITKLKD